MTLTILGLYTFLEELAVISRESIAACMRRIQGNQSVKSVASLAQNCDVVKTNERLLRRLRS